MSHACMSFSSSSLAQVQKSCQSLKMFISDEVCVGVSTRVSMSFVSVCSHTLSLWWSISHQFVPASCIVSALVFLALFPLCVFPMSRLQFPEKVLKVCLMFPFGKPICVRDSGGVSAVERLVSHGKRKKKRDGIKVEMQVKKQSDCLRLTKVSLKASEADNMSLPLELL